MPTKVKTAPPIKTDNRGGVRIGAGRPSIINGQPFFTGVNITKQQRAEIAEFYPDVSLSAYLRGLIDRNLAEYKKKQLRLFDKAG